MSAHFSEETTQSQQREMLINDWVVKATKGDSLTSLEQLSRAEQFLRHARNGDLRALSDLVEGGGSDENSTGKFTKLSETNRGIDLNYRGKQKVYLGWTALHLACYFNKIEIVKYLLQVWERTYIFCGNKF